MARGFLSSALVVAVALTALSGCAHAAKGYGPQDYADSATYQGLVIEIATSNGLTASASAVDLLAQRARERLDKPDGVRLERTEFSSNAQRHNVDSLDDLADRVRRFTPT